ncbi:MAG TPA: YkvA family protein [Stenomitos sp.]
MNNFPQSIYNWYRNTLRNPKYRWWVILGSLLYIVSPIDISPDFIPIIGQIDDVVILTLLVSEVSQLLIDTAKARKGETVASSTENVTDQTVDVDAVSVK